MSTFSFFITKRSNLTFCVFFSLLDTLSKVKYVKDVHFGDVWVCSGQSNMGWQMGNILNATEEIEKTAEYPNIRLFQVKQLGADKPQDDLIEYMDEFQKWVPSNDKITVKIFSAVCLLTARYMADVLGKNKVSVKIFTYFLFQ